MKPFKFLAVKNTLLRVALPITLVLVLLVAGGTALTAHAGASQTDQAPAVGLVNGTVTSPLGYPLPAGTLVKLFEPGTENVRGIAHPDLATGAFSLGPVPNGMYIVKAVPLATSGLTQSLPKAISVINAPVDVGSLALTEPQIIGTVTQPDGLTPSPADVFVHVGGGQLFQVVHAPDGHFLIGGLPVGSYKIQAIPTSDDPFWKSPHSIVDIAAPGVTQTLTLTLEAAQLWGTIQDAEGAPVRLATVFATNRSGIYRADLSRLSGYWAIGGLPAGSYRLAALPPWEHSGLLPPEPITVTIPSSANPYTLTFGAPPKLITGTVKTNTDLPVYHAQVLARQVDRPGRAEALTAADGTYQLDLAPGLWALTIRPVTDTAPGGWVYPEPPQYIFFHHNNHPETRTQNFTAVLADATVTGAVELPGGGTPTFTVTVGLHSDEGVGLRTDLNPDGTFTLHVPNGGYKVVIHPQDPGYVGPVLDPITVPENGTYDLGTLTLLARDAAITGTLTANGAGVEGIPVVAWRAGIAGSLRTLSGPGGLYTLAVSAGGWHIQPAPGKEQPYLYTEAGADVTLAAGQITTGVSFNLTATDAVISGVLVDENGSPVNAGGWVTAQDVVSPTVHNGAPIEGGTFTINIPAGTYQVSAHLPAGSPYMSARDREVVAAPGAATNITLTVRLETALITGALWDPRNSVVVDGLAGLVGAWQDGAWVVDPINTANGTYALGVADGLWHLNYRVDPAGGYAKIGEPRNIPIENGQTLVVPLPVVAKDAILRGVVRAPNGSPLPGATVLVKGVSGVVRDLWLQTRSRPNGEFSLPVPFGAYRLSASLAGSAWIQPLEVEVSVAPGGTSGGHVLQFLQPDAVISGTLLVSNTVEGGLVHLWAWSDDGGFVRGRFPVTETAATTSGPYAIDVISNTTWHLGAVIENSSVYWFGRATVTLGPGGKTQDLTLDGPFPKPAPVVVTFDASEAQDLTLADGTRIYLPAGAMPATGLVTLRVVPIATLPHQQHASLLKYGYAFLATDERGQPIEGHFNQDVVISFHYTDEELAARHLYEEHLKPAYFSTTTNRWTFPDSFAVDAEHNLVVMQIDHFTDFALTGSAEYGVYLPLVIKK